MEYIKGPPCALLERREESSLFITILIVIIEIMTITILLYSFIKTTGIRHIILYFTILYHKRIYLINK